MQNPSHHALPTADVPVTSLGDGSTVRLYAGDLADETGPAPLPIPVLVAHVALEPGSTVTIPVPSGWNVALTIVGGKAEAPEVSLLGPGDTLVFNDDGDTVTVASNAGAQFLLMAGEPIGEPIAVSGSFVMNTQAEIETAFADSRAGRLGTLAPSR